MKKIILLSVCSFSFALANSQIITTIAGNGTQGYSGDGGQATSAEFYYPNAVGFDGAGNMYVADESNSAIREINLSGVISTVAGNRIAGFSGDGGQASSAEIKYPEGVCGDKFGNIYIADLGNRRIRKVNTAGIISTYAGNGLYTYSGDGGPATSAGLVGPYRVAVDTAGNVYIADQSGNRIRKVDTAGIITTVAGTDTSGYSGDGGPATAAELKDPYGLSVDISGNIYIADEGNNRVRKVSTTGIITTVAGNGVGGFDGDGAAATSAELRGPWGVASDANGNVYIDDIGNNRIRLVNSSGIISTYAGNGYPGYSGDGGTATSAEIYSPWDVSVDASGNVYIADEQNQRVREVPADFSTSVSELPTTNQLSVSVYPNPNNGKFNIQLSVGSGESSEEKTLPIVEVYNLLGKNVLTETLRETDGNNTIDLSNQPAGVYIYRVINENDGTAISGKVVIEK